MLTCFISTLMGYTVKFKKLLKFKVWDYFRYSKLTVIGDDYCVFLWNKPINSDYEERFFTGNSCVWRMLLISAGVCACLSIVTCVVTVINGLVLTAGISGKEISQETWTPTIRHQKHSADESNIYFQANPGAVGRERRKSRNPPRLIRDLQPVILKLRNVIEKYDQKNKDLNALYKGVTNCGLSNCGKFPDVLPRKIEPKNFKCRKFKRKSGWKKPITQILSKGYNDLETYEDQFEKLIHSENHLGFRKAVDKSNEIRLTILREFQREIRAVNLEILELKVVRTNKRLNAFEDRTKMASKLRHHISESQTDLKIKEWRILQQSREYLRLFCETLEAVSKCRKKRESRGDGRKKKAKKCRRRPSSLPFSCPPPIAVALLSAGA